MIELIYDKEAWNKVIDSMSDADSYHTYEYHQISKQHKETPVLLHYSKADHHIALPLLLRDIEGTSYKDVTSVYGYLGPIMTNVPPNFNNRDFAKAVEGLFTDQNIVCVFSRLHPYIPYQDTLLQGLGEFTLAGRVVNIDLTQELQFQRKQYQKRMSTYINKARREYEVVPCDNEKDVYQFIDLYNENMRRVKAREKYFFKDSYFFNLLSSHEFETELLLAVDRATELISGGAIFLKRNNIVQYHLSGAREANLRLNPIKLLIDEMRLRATQEGFTYFNLGGGVGTNCGSLFEFKAKFSKDHRQFKLWKYVVNKDVYNNLIHEISMKFEPDQIKDCEDFFPLYRCNILKPHFA